MEKMYDVEFQNELQVALEDEAFVTKVAQLTTKDELKEAFLEKGITLDDELVTMVKDNLDTIRETGELSEELLDAVSGGSILGGIVMIGAGYVTGKIVWKIGKAIIDRIYR